MPSQIPNIGVLKAAIPSRISRKLHIFTKGQAGTLQSMLFASKNTKTKCETAKNKVLEDMFFSRFNQLEKMKF